MLPIKENKYFCYYFSLQSVADGCCCFIHFGDLAFFVILRTLWLKKKIWNFFPKKIHKTVSGEIGPKYGIFQSRKISSTKNQKMPG